MALNIINPASNWNINIIQFCLALTVEPKLDFPAPYGILPKKFPSSLTILNRSTKWRIRAFNIYYPLMCGMMISSAVETNQLHLKKCEKRVKSAFDFMKPSNGTNADLPHFYYDLWRRWIPHTGSRTLYEVANNQCRAKLNGGMLKMGKLILRVVFILTVLAISGPLCSCSGGGEDGEYEERNEITLDYYIYASNGDSDFEVDTNELGYHPEEYAEEEGFEYVGNFISTQTIALPTDSRILLIHVPKSGMINIDAIEFQDQNQDPIGYIGCDSEGNPVGSSLNTGNLGCHPSVDPSAPYYSQLSDIYGLPDGVGTILGSNCSEDHPNQEGYILTALNGAAYVKIIILD